MGLFDTVITTITEFGSVLGDTVLSLVMMLMYPLLVVSSSFLSILENIFNTFYSFVGMFIAVIEYLFNTIGYIFSALFPSAISAIFLLLILLVIALALWKRFGGVTIAGFSLGGR